MTEIRGTRGGGGICSEAKACETRARQTSIFKGWYDLGGYLPTPLMAIRQPRYHPQFFYVEMPVVTYDAIITFIPKIKITVKDSVVDPKNYIKDHPFLSSIGIHADIDLDEKELKALLAYLNSTFVWLWLEQNARYIAKGPLGLEVNILRDMPILNVKKLKREDVEELAKLFDDLESRARQLVRGEETKLEMFEALKPYFQTIDRKIAELLGIPIDVEWLWNSAWEMMERRIKGARGPTRPGAEVSIEIDVGKKRRNRRSRSSSPGTTVSLDKWLKPGGK